MKNTLLLCFALISISLGAQTIERIDTIRTVTEETVTDTLMNVSTHTDSTRVELPPVVWKETTRKGHYVQAGIGAGYGSMGFSGRNSGLTTAGHAAGMAHVQYAYFFHENVGASLGFGVSSYGGSTVLNTTYHWNGLDDDGKTIDESSIQDNEGEVYNHTTYVRDWTERQRMWAMEIPISLQYQQIYGPKGGMYVSAGIALGLPFDATWHLTDGSLKHEGYYPWSNLTLDENANPYFATDRVGEQFDKDKHRMDIALIQTTVRGEIGWLYPVAPEWDIMVGAYARYTVIGMTPGNTAPFGFAHSDANHDLTMVMRDEGYSGMTHCRAAGEPFPWQVGVHFGVQWHYRKTHTDAQERWDQFTVYDTTYTPHPRVVEHVSYRYDTVYAAVAPEPVSTPEPAPEPTQLTELAKHYHILFDFDCAAAKAESQEDLQVLAEELLKRPDVRLRINGHTCTVGNYAYNKRLSARRAQYVIDQLVKMGVQRDRLELNACSSDVPALSGEHDLSLDRRVTITVLDGK